MLVPGEVAWVEADDTLVLVNLPTGAYQGLSAAAREVWDAVVGTGSAAEAVRVLVAVHDVDEATVARDVHRLVGVWLQDHWLVEATA